ncbi:MAG: FAD-dependent oxidoreductase [bacterium]|nr:FAD-dependent oxidoreductase [bacterium]
MTDRGVLVLGGGVAGLAAALSLACMGFEVTVVERERALGGRAAGYACKATDRCLHCGVCLVSDLQDELASATVNLRTGAVLEELAGQAGDFRATVAGTVLKVGAVVVATGMDPAPATGWPDLGYGRREGVLTASELESRLRREGVVDARRVAFVQCVGSRNPAWGRGYCSEVCCPYALRLGLSLIAQQPGLEVTVFYNDLQTGGSDLAGVYEQAGRKLRLLQGVPARAEAGPDGIEVRYESVPDAVLRRESFDLLVLSTGIWPRADAAALARLLGINLDASGFYAARPGESWRSSRPGIYLAGCCQKPRGIAASVAHGRAAAAAVAAGRLEVTGV